MIKLFWMALAGAALALGGCSYFRAASDLNSIPVTQEQLNTARQSVLALRSGYNLGVVALAHWVDLPRCASPATVSPLCTTRDGIIAVAKAQASTGAAIVKVEDLVSQAKPDASALSVAMDSARAAYAIFQQVQASYGGK